MKVGTVIFKKSVRLTGEPTIGNERRIHFTAGRPYIAALDPERMKTHFTDIHFIHRAWVSGVNPKLFSFTPDKRH
jgi:hypothetical protein